MARQVPNIHLLKKNSPMGRCVLNFALFNVFVQLILTLLLEMLFCLILLSVVSYSTEWGTGMHHMQNMHRKYNSRDIWIILDPLIMETVGFPHKIWKSDERAKYMDGKVRILKRKGQVSQTNKLTK